MQNDLENAAEDNNYHKDMRDTLVEEVLQIQELLQKKFKKKFEEQLLQFPFQLFKEPSNVKVGVHTVLGRLQHLTRHRWQHDFDGVESVLGGLPMIGKKWVLLILKRAL